MIIIIIIITIIDGCLIASLFLYYSFIIFSFLVLTKELRIANRIKGPTSHVFVSLGAGKNHAGNTKPPRANNDRPCSRMRLGRLTA